MMKCGMLIAAWSLGSMLVGDAAAAQTLRIGLASDVDILDPALTRSFSSSVAGAALCDKLVDNGTEMEIVPQLATEWEWTSDRMGLVIKLRPNVKFHDG